MRETATASTGFGAARGLLYMRIRELATKRSLLRSVAAFALVLALLLLLLLDPGQGAERFRALARGPFLVSFLPLYCLAKGGQALRGELKEGTIEYLWTRSSSRVQLYLGFALSALLDAAAVVGPCLLALTLAGFALGGFAGPGELLLLWLASAAVAGGFTLISVALGALSSKYVVLGIFYFAFVDLGLGQIPNAVQKIALTSHVRQLAASFRSEAIPTSFGSAASALLWMAAIGLLALAAGAALFRASRYVAGSEKES